MGHPVAVTKMSSRDCLEFALLFSVSCLLSPDCKKELFKYSGSRLLGQCSFDIIVDWRDLLYRSTCFRLLVDKLQHLSD